jgi:hypothetical protein
VHPEREAITVEHSMSECIVEVLQGGSGTCTKKFPTRHKISDEDIRSSSGRPQHGATN